MAPPSTDSAVMSTPTADSANSRPTTSKTERTILVATLRSDRSCKVWFSTRFSTVAEIHKASTSITPADSAPWTRPSRLILDLPKAIWMASISAITTGSSPTIQSTAAIQASQEKTRSTMRATSEFGNIPANTRASNRIPARETRIGTATLSSVTGWLLASTSMAL